MTRARLSPTGPWERVRQQGEVWVRFFFVTPMRVFVLSAVIAALPGLLLAGEGGYRKCPLETQKCLDTMVAKSKGRGWLGIEYEDGPGPKRFQVTRVVPGSPAEAAGFRAGDLLVSVKGVRFAENTEERCVTCEATKEIWRPGAKVSYVVLRGKTSVSLEAVLASLPPDVMAQIIGMHLLEHAQPLPPSGRP